MLTSLRLPKEHKNPARFLKLLKTKPEEFWIKRGEQRALLLFHLMADRVPAYKDFLSKHNIDHRKIKTIADFQTIPTIDKNNYLRVYPLKDLCWDGKLADSWHVYSSTSGSTGEPFFFPRDTEQDEQYAINAEMYLLNNFQIDKKTTLYVDGFAMGAWIGGLFTYQAIRNTAERGKYPLSIITPGLDKAGIVRIIKNLGKNYEQVILGGYPPFSKDVIDEGVAQGLNWAEYNMKFVFSAEAFGEMFRDYIARYAGLKNIYRDTLNHYGTVDQGTIAHETPVSVLARRLAVENKAAYKEIFGEIYKLPTLAQAVPEMFYFENFKDKILCSSFSGLPLVRYDVKDRGGVFTLKELKERFSKVGINLNKEIEKEGISDTVMNVPFVYVYEREDFSVCLSGANIYPEPIRRTIQDKHFEKYVTGKFTLLIRHDDNQNPYLEINIELKKGNKAHEVPEREMQERIVKVLLDENDEYKSQYLYSKERATPKLVFWDYESPQYFSGRGKQKWVMK